MAAINENLNEDRQLPDTPVQQSVDSAVESAPAIDAEPIPDIDTNERSTVTDTAAPVDAANSPDPRAKVEASSAAPPPEAQPTVMPFPFCVDRPSCLDSARFPDQPRPGKTTMPPTVANTKYMLEQYGVICRYDSIKKKQEVLIPGLECIQDNMDNTAWTHVVNLASINQIYSANTERYIQAIANLNPYNPVAQWISSRRWDGEDRLQTLIDTLTTESGFPEFFKRTLIHKWARSAVAAVFRPSGFSARGVLVLQGAQALGKTSWVKALISDPLLRESVMKLDHHLDGSNKDTIITAVTHWIVEIGELDSSFRKDIARLKGLITADTDKVRLPYHRRDSEFPRRTVFCATVNARHFLVDDTGNSRWWTLPITAANYEHGIDMQQFWAQIHAEFEFGTVQWWLTSEEEELLDLHNRDHRAVNTIRERVEAEIDFAAKESGKLFYTATQALQKVGIASPSNRQAQQAGAVLREHFGEPRKRNGISGWLVPFKAGGSGNGNKQQFTSIDQEDDY